MPNNLVITDTSCLISLSKIDKLILLKNLYKNIFITESILQEYGETLPDWIIVKKVNNPNQQKILETILDKGEASAICLALQLEDVILILDDLRARKEAKKLGLRFTGTLGVIFKAKQAGFIPNLKTELQNLKANGFFISSEVERDMLSRSGEN